jgi:hypothetical protein
MHVSLNRAEVQKIAEDTEKRLHAELALLLSVAEVKGAATATSLLNNYLQALHDLITSSMYLSLAIVIDATEPLDSKKPTVQ